MDRALQVTSYLVAVSMAMSAAVLVAGLAMAARPEVFAGLGLLNTSRDGLVIALMGGLGVLLSAVVDRLLSSLRASLRN